MNNIRLYISIRKLSKDTGEIQLMFDGTVSMGRPFYDDYHVGWFCVACFPMLTTRVGAI